MKNRKSANLFEIILTNRRRQHEPVRVPGWWNAPRDGESTGRGQADRRSPDSTVSVMAWLAGPWRLAMPRALWLIVLAALVGLPMVIYRLGASDPPTAGEADRRSQDRMTALRRQDANALPLSRLNTAGSASGASASADRPETGSAAAPTGDPRTPGLNYFCLETMPARYRDQAERAARFLRRNGVDVAIIPVQNSRIQLIALRGFERPHSDPQAREYRNLLRSLGRAWKLEHRGWSDWSDTYPAKYTGH